jgi:hypothetical protein
MTRESKDVRAIRKLSAKIGGKSEVAYALEKAKGKLLTSSVSRILGAPIGVSDKEWPLNARGEPMVHLLSLDFADVPALARRKARAVSVFVDDPDVNDCLFEPNPNNAKILYVSEKAIASGVTAKHKTKPARPIRITSLEVPQAVFGSDGSGFEDDELLDELHNELFGLEGLAARQPIWSAAGKGHDGTFLLQFSEFLIPINLGDCGTMYVFDDVAFFQGQ